jgi:hypothetical protein
LDLPKELSVEFSLKIQNIFQVIFEQLNYSLSLDSFKLIGIYFFLINAGLFIFGLLGAFMAKIANIATPYAVKILIGYALYTSIAWWLYKSGNSRFIFLSLILMVVFSIACLLATLRTRKIELPLVASWMCEFSKNLVPLFAIELVFIIFWSGFLSNHPFHIIVNGNNDVYFWGFMSDHVMGLADLARINAGESGLSNQIIDCFGVYAWLGLMGKISMKGHSIEAMMLFQLSLSVLIGWLIYEISANVIGVNKLAGLVPVFVFSFNPLWINIFTNNFLSQMVAMTCFLCSLYVLGRAKDFSSTKNNVVCGMLFYACFVLSYPGLLLPYIVFAMGSIAVFIFFLFRANSLSPWEQIFKTTASVAVGMSLAAMAYWDLTSHAIGRFSVLAGVAAGWSLSMLDPLNMIGLVAALDKTRFSNWTSYFLLSFFIGTILLIRIFFRKRWLATEAGYTSLLFLSFAALAAYMGVYFLKGDGYQHWKFATYFPFPLLVLVMVNYFSPKNHD